MRPGRQPARPQHLALSEEAQPEEPAPETEPAPGAGLRPLRATSSGHSATEPEAEALRQELPPDRAEPEAEAAGGESGGGLRLFLGFLRAGGCCAHPPAPV